MKALYSLDFSIFILQGQKLYVSDNPKLSPCRVSLPLAQTVSQNHRSLEMN